jgi:predicted membrane-bound spermidine synthase
MKQTRWQFALTTETEQVQTYTAKIGWGYKTILFASFLVGFIGLGFEMLWIRILLIVNKNTAYAFPSILFVFLLGLALGGYLWGRKADTSSDPVALFCKIEMSGAVVAVFTFLLFGLSLQHHMDSARSTLADPRVTYLVDDGRRYLNAFPDEKFDLISIDPLRGHTAGHNNLYSEEALNIYRDHLIPNGVLCAWMDEFHVIPQTVAQVFPFVDQYENAFMVAGSQPIHYATEYMRQVAASYMELTYHTVEYKI